MFQPFGAIKGLGFICLFCLFGFSASIWVAMFSHGPAVACAVISAIGAFLGYGHESNNSFRYALMSIAQNFAVAITYSFLPVQAAATLDQKHIMATSIIVASGIGYLCGAWITRQYQIRRFAHN